LYSADNDRDHCTETLHPESHDHKSTSTFFESATSRTNTCHPQSMCTCDCCNPSCFGTYPYYVFSCYGSPANGCAACQWVGFCSNRFCPNCLIGIPGFLVSTAMCPLLLLCDIGCIGLCNCFGACNDTCGDCWTYRGYIDRTGCVCYVEDKEEMGARVMSMCKD